MNTVFKKNLTEDTMTYYYNRPRNIFVTKLQFLELNGDVDMVVVDKTMTAQDIDVVFNDIYNTQ
jgi:hypothetical protein